MKKLVITFDGGGLRGIWTSVLIEKLYSKYPHLRDEVELYAGASTGGLIALALAGGLDPSAVSDIYKKDGPKIFKKSFFRTTASLNGIIYSRYENKRLLETVRRSFSSMPKTIRELQTRVIVPTFRLRDEYSSSWEPHFFHNYSERGRWETSCVDLAMRTTATPGYFPVYQGYIDGGVVANNPSMIAAGRVKSEYNQYGLDKIVLLSFGTGTVRKSMKEGGSKGFLSWAKPIVSIFMHGIGSVPDYQCQQFVKNYLRVDSLMDDDLNFDDIKTLKVLEKHALLYDISYIEKFLEQNGLV